MSDQPWGPCPECGGRYIFETEGAVGMDAFKVTMIECLDCGLKVSYLDSPTRSAPDYWRTMRHRNTMSKTTFKQQIDAGYDAAADMDRQINEMVEQFPPDKEEHRFYWLAFCRTMQTTLSLIEDASKNSRPRERKTG